MAKYIKKIKKIKEVKPVKTASGLSVSANISQKKIIKNLKKSLKNLPIENIVFSLDGQKIHSNNRSIIGTILIVLGLTSIAFGYYNYQKQPIIPQCILPESSYVEPQIIVTTPKPINKKVKISILNATYQNNIAKNLKNVLNQNRFESVTVGNNKTKTNYIVIQYKSEFKSEAQYLKDNYSALSFADLSVMTTTNSPNDIIITLGKQIITK